MHNHCCSEMQKNIATTKPAFMYLPPFREYVIPDCKSLHAKQIFYCPWCKAKLPPSLRKQFDETLLNEYDIELIPGCLDDAHRYVPEEFHTDEWWKKRNL